MKKTILYLGMIAGLAMAVPNHASAFVINWFEGAGVTAQGKAVVVSAMGIGGAGKGIVINGRQVVALTCAKFEPPTRTAKALKIAGGTLYAGGKTVNGQWYSLKAVDGGPGGADEFGYVLDVDKPGHLCGGEFVPTQRLRSGQFVALIDPNS